jgi:hypothetical protein
VRASCRAFVHLHLFYHCVCTLIFTCMHHYAATIKFINFRYDVELFADLSQKLFDNLTRPNTKDQANSTRINSHINSDAFLSFHFDMMYVSDCRVVAAHVS